VGRWWTGLGEQPGMSMPKRRRVVDQEIRLHTDGKTGLNPYRRWFSPNVGDLGVLDDPYRLAALRGLDLLDSPPKHNLDRLVQLACDLLEAPIGLLTLVDARRQFFLGAWGIPEPLASARQTPLDYSICQYAVASARPLILGDMRHDAVLGTNPVVSEMGVVAYAGIPLTTPQGLAFGALCVIDVVPRDWDDHQLATLAQLAGAVDEICVNHEGWSPFDDHGPTPWDVVASP
jgi:hypothetical protein